MRPEIWRAYLAGATALALGALAMPSSAAAKPARTDAPPAQAAFVHTPLTTRNGTRLVAPHGWSIRRCVPHGGHQLSLNIAAGLGLGGNESYPHVFKPFNGFADDVPVENSYVAMPDAPGIGFELKNDLFAIMKQITTSPAPSTTRVPRPATAQD